MFASRKPLAIALALVMVLAMLVPAAMAAPEWVHGVKITAPTEAAPAWVNPGAPVKDLNKDGLIDNQDDGPADEAFTIKYDLSIIGTQTRNINVRFQVFNANGDNVWGWQYDISPTKVVSGTNAMVSPLLYPGMLDHGKYDIEVCADGEAGEWFCDTQAKALIIDRDAPGARLVSPMQDEWISGQAYRLVGKAWDPNYAENEPTWRYGGIKSTRFDYCSATLWVFSGGKWMCGAGDDRWVKLADGVASGVPDQYVGNKLWDSSQQPDEDGWVRFCATDNVELKACETHYVHIVNRYTVSLREGWNLISTPLMLYDDKLADVLSHLKDAKDQPLWDSIYAMTNKDADQPNEYAWDFRTSAGVGSLAKIEHGRGYWINMKAPGSLTFVGTWRMVGPVVPPEYRVFEGWNLIGYTHWGQPTWWGNKTVADYLSLPLLPAVKQLWGYDAASTTFFPLDFNDYFSKGMGYWLSLAEGGTITP